MGLQDEIFCDYMVFLKKTEQDREQFEQKAIKAVDDYLTGKGL